MKILTFMVWYLDQGLIAVYRISPVPVVGYLIGTFVLALLCALLGHLTLAVGIRANRGTLDADKQRMIRMHNLSFKALAAKEKAAYTACNHQANSAYGKLFFAQAALSMAALWPVPFALEWMGLRFSGISFALPVVGTSVSYPFTFIPMYVLARILTGIGVKRLRKSRRVSGEAAEEEAFLRLTDLVDHSEAQS